MLVSSLFSFTFHDTSNYLTGGDENELKSLSRASFLKTTSGWKGEIGLAYCDTVEAFLLYRFPVSILVSEHLHNITTYRLATTVQEKPGCILYF